ncbi:MAG: isoprenyl transferase [SAR324 cluster bacterium]|nr:isoprenyl transferase [SAR324 cluster bacterium]MBL7034996.1 isoprenyl transferase [SAR324 cluster bacterium]
MSFFAKIDRETLPQHVAIIMDGNGRWATQRRMPRLQGHRNAVKAVRSCVEASAELGLKILTLYAFSTENWQRPKKEVSALMNLFFEFLEKELQTMLKNNVRFQLIGDRDGLPDFLQKRLSHALESTAGNTGLLLNLAINYGGRDEMVRAVRTIAEAVKEGDLLPENVDEALISANTYTAGQPDPDLIIRTSGELRLSNFLIWQAAYAEFYFTEVLWPDFTKENLYEALVEFQQRKRRMGRTTDSGVYVETVMDAPLKVSSINKEFTSGATA